MTTNTISPNYHDMARNGGSWSITQWTKFLADVQAKIEAGKPVFVKFTREKRRAGSIGKIVGLEIKEDQRYYKNSSWSYSSRHDPNNIITIPTIQEVQVGWDDRKNVVKVSPYELELVEDRDESEGTHYVFTQTVREKKEPKKVIDQLGEQVGPGDFVTFIHRKYGRISLKFGTITRITDAGTVFVQTLKVRDGERQEELRCKDNDLVIVDKRLMDRLTMAKLAAN